jgi:CheY-like chemotaxis protein
MAIHGSILLADDEEKILKRLGRALRDEGHDVVEAGSAREAQRQLAGRTFDLLVVDNLMPGMTGLELIREIASMPSPERPQVVMMTAHGSTRSSRPPAPRRCSERSEAPGRCPYAESRNTDRRCAPRPLVQYRCRDPRP